MKLRHGWLLILSLLSVGFAIAQDTCPDVIQEALSTLHTNCFSTERNQACYGNISLTAVPERGVTEFKFDTIGDIANVADIRSLDLEPMNETAQEWGLVMMRLQANIPDTLPGQNVTFLLFGDVSIENMSSEGQNPMQSFYLTTGTGDARCLEAPQSGLMVQTPKGIKEVSFNVNGVDVEMGSTVIFQAERGKQMRIITVEGKAKLKIGKRTVAVVQGSQYTAPVNENLEITEPDQGEVAPYQPQDVQSLPVEVLDRPIAVHEPLTPVQIEDVKLRQQINVPLCSDEVGSYLPPCTRPLVDTQGNEVAPTANGNEVVLVDASGAPRFYDQNGDPITTLDDYYRYLSYWTETPTLSDDHGNTINVSDDGTVAVVDVEGNTFTAEPDGTYTYTEVGGATYTAVAPTLEGAFVLDETGAPVAIDESGNVFPTAVIELATDLPPGQTIVTEFGTATIPEATTDPAPTADAPPQTNPPESNPPESSPPESNPPPDNPPPEGTSEG